MTRGNMRKLRQVALAGILFVLIPLAGCRSDWIDATIDNRSGQTVRELEVDYPTASFGTNSLIPGAQMHYRFQIRGEGPVKVTFTGQDGKIFHAQGLTLSEHRHGELLIRLLPVGQVEFIPKLQPAS